MTVFAEFGVFACRLGCALIAGGILGREREVHDKPAGLRTNMIVSVGSALFVRVGAKLSESSAASGTFTGAELSRVIQGIIGGIGFLGAGSIIQSRHHVRGLTTASAIWLSAGLGVASGLGYYVLVLVAVAVGMVVLIVFGTLESKLLPPDKDVHRGPARHEAQSPGPI